MFFIVSKILGVFLSPILWIFTFLLAALLVKKHRKKLIIWALFLFFIFGNSFIFDEFARLLECETKNWNTLPNYETAIVLGGFSTYNESNKTINFREASDRMIQAVHLYKQQKINTILFSGGSGSLLGLDQEGVYIFEFLKQLHIPVNHLIIDSLSKNTRENAENSLQLIKQNNLKGPFLLITSAAHMPRAKRCFEKLGVEVHTYPVDKHIGPRKFYFDHLFIPNAATFQNWNAFLHEILGLIVYKAKGYI